LTLLNTLTRLTFVGLALTANIAIVSAQNITETFELIPSDNPFGAQFGSSVAMSGRIGVVGAPNDLLGSITPHGSAYLFDVATGQEIAKLLPSDGEPHQRFGFSVSISGDIAIVGKPLDHGAGTSPGAVYLFDTNTGVQLAQLLPSDGEPHDRFGWSVSISGDKILVGAPFEDGNGNTSGAAYLFDATTGQQQAKLLASNGLSGDQFGSSVAISGDLAIVGAAYRDQALGSAYLFNVSNPQAPVEAAQLQALDGEHNDLFGWDVAINDEIAVVGAPSADVGTLPNIGSAYLFDVSTGEQLSRITPPWTLTNAFAASVSISGENIVAGDAGSWEFQRPGTAYVFNADTGALVAMLESSHNSGDATNLEGFDVSMQGNSILVGAPWHSHDGATASGASHLFHLEPGHSFCFGETSLQLCPCNNFSGFDRGCSNSTGVGASLDAEGSTSVVHDNLVLRSSNLPAGLGLFVQANNYIFGFFGYGSPFGDGLRCVGGGLIRLEVQRSSDGSSHTTIPIASRGKVSASDTKYYQHYYRDTNGSACGAGFNLSNAYVITWTP